MVLALGTIGCGVGGGDSSGSSTGDLEIRLAPVRIFREGSAASQGLFASVKGSNVSGGRLEDPQKTEIVNSDLRFENASNRYQILLESPSGSFQPGAYTLKYFVGGETKSFVRENVEWTTIPEFNTSLTLYWEAVSKYLTISAPSLPGNPRYHLEFYDANSGFFRRETPETMNPASIVEYIAESGDYRVGVVADLWESNTIRAKCVYFFKDTLSTY